MNGEKVLKTYYYSLGIWLTANSYSVFINKELWNTLNVTTYLAFYYMYFTCYRLFFYPEKRPVWGKQVIETMRFGKGTYVLYLALTYIAAFFFAFSLDNILSYINLVECLFTIFILHYPATRVIIEKRPV